MNPQYLPWFALTSVLAVFTLVYLLNTRNSRAGRSRYSHSRIIPLNQKPPKDTGAAVRVSGPTNGRFGRQIYCPLPQPVWREKVGKGGGTEAISRPQEQDWLSEFEHLLPEGANKPGGERSGEISESVAVLELPAANEKTFLQEGESPDEARTLGDLAEPESEAAAKEASEDEIAKIDVTIVEVAAANAPEAVNNPETGGEAARIRIDESQTHSWIEGGRTLSEPLIKAEVVIGENTRQVMLESNFTLFVPAVKIRDIQARVLDITAQIIPNKIVIQGVVHKQIFFVDANNRVMHQAENVPFSTFIDVPGAGTNMNVQVRPVVEHVGFIFTPPTLLHQKVVLEIFVKVTETRQINVITGNGPLVMVEQVVAENTRQALEQNQVVLTRPAVKVSEITATLRDVTTELLENKVVIQGIVHKQIYFVGTDNIQYHQAEDVEFSTFVDVPGAVSGMNVELRAEVEHIGFELLSETLLLQQVVIQFFVKITETVQLNLNLGTGPLLKVEEVRGENVTQTLVENEILLDRPSIKIREIVAQVRDVTAEAILGKVIVQGIVHKQIFYIGTDNLEYHQAENVPFSFFVDIPGAAADRNIHVRPFIEHISFHLLDERTLQQKVVLETFVKVTETVQIRVAETIISPYVSPYVSPYICNNTSICNTNVNSNLSL